MTAMAKPVDILVAEDDPDDRLLIKDAFEEARLSNKIIFVEDGVELLDYLRRTGRFADLSIGHMPGLILLDLNMPRMDGREALKKIKKNPDLRRVPVVVLTTSKAEQGVIRTYNLGANSFITKPVTFEKLVAVVRSIANYWLQIVALPQS